MFPENWHFKSCLVLKTTKTPLFVFITEILWQTFWRNKWQSVFDFVKILTYCVKISLPETRSSKVSPSIVVIWAQELRRPLVFPSRPRMISWKFQIEIQVLGRFCKSWYWPSKLKFISFDGLNYIALSCTRKLYFPYFFLFCLRSCNDFWLLNNTKGQLISKNNFSWLPMLRKTNEIFHIQNGSN